MELIQVLIIYPIAIILLSVLLYWLLRIWFVMPLVTLAAFVILSYAVYNESFLFWAIIYTLISLVITLLTKSIIGVKQAHS